MTVRRKETIVIGKVCYAIGYTSEVMKIGAKNAINMIPVPEVINKQKQHMTNGSQAAQVAYVTSQISACVEQNPEGSVEDIANSVTDLREQLAYLGFSEEVFEQAKTRVIEKITKQGSALEFMQELI